MVCLHILLLSKNIRGISVVFQIPTVVESDVLCMHLCGVEIRTGVWDLADGGSCSTLCDCLLFRKILGVLFLSLQIPKVVEMRADTCSCSFYPSIGSKGFHRWG